MGFRKYFFAFILIIAGLVSNAQNWEVGGFMGASGYMGDLNPINPFHFKDLAYGGQVKYNFDGSWSLKLNGMHGKIRAADSTSSNLQQRERNLSFYSPVTELSLQLEFNFFEYIASLSNKRYSPYLFTGVGGVLFNPKSKYQGVEYELSIYGTEGQNIEAPYKRYAMTIPYGLGVKYNITGPWTLIGELGYRTAYTDFLDDVSGLYPQKAALYNNIAVALSDRTGEKTGIYTGAAGSQRGNLRKHDTYMFAGISLTFTFISQKCPVVQ